MFGKQRRGDGAAGEGGYIHILRYKRRRIHYLDRCYFLPFNIKNEQSVNCNHFVTNFVIFLHFVLKKQFDLCKIDIEIYIIGVFSKNRFI